jgi:Tfp pilus assembly protein PilN
MRGYGGISKIDIEAAQKRIEEFQRADMDPITLAKQVRLQEEAQQQAARDYKRFMDSIWAAIPISIVAWLIFFCAFSYFYR